MNNMKQLKKLSIENIWQSCALLETGKRVESPCVRQATRYLLFTSAISLLLYTETFACCVSTLSQYVPHLHNLLTQVSTRVTILMHSLVQTPDPHRKVASSAPTLKMSFNSGFQVAGLQEHATTPSHQILLSEWQLIANKDQYCCLQKTRVFCMRTKAQFPQPVILSTCDRMLLYQTFLTSISSI